MILFFVNFHARASTQMEPPDFISVLRFLLLLLLIAFIFLNLSPLFCFMVFFSFLFCILFYFAPWFSFFLLWVNM